MRTPIDHEEPLTPKFESIKSLILEPKCIACHKPGGKAENIPLLTRSDLLDSPHDLVIPGNADESGLRYVKIILRGPYGAALIISLVSTFKSGS